MGSVNASISFQLVFYKSHLRVFIASKLKILLKIKGSFVFYLGLVDGNIKQIGKWSETLTFKIAVLRFLSIKELLRIWSIAVTKVLVTLVGLFIYLIHDQVD